MTVGSSVHTELETMMPVRVTLMRAGSAKWPTWRKQAMDRCGILRSLCSVVSSQTQRSRCKPTYGQTFGSGLFAFLLDSLWRNNLMLFLIVAIIVATVAFVIINDNCWPDC